MSDTPQHEPDQFGRWMLMGLVGFIGLCILGFGAWQLIDGNTAAGLLIIFIGLVDLGALLWIRNKL